MRNDRHLHEQSPPAHQRVIKNVPPCIKQPSKSNLLVYCCKNFRSVFRTQSSIYDGAFIKIDNGFKPFTIFASITDVRLGSKYTSEFCILINFFFFFMKLSKNLKYFIIFDPEYIIKTIIQYWGIHIKTPVDQRC